MAVLTHTSARRRRKIGDNALAYAFLAAALVCFALFSWWPMLRGIILSFQVFEVAYVVSQASAPGATLGGPGEATYFYSLHVYQKAFRDFDFGYAAALSWILFAVLLIFTQVQFSGSNRWVHYEGERE